jgi:hypothetical protein
VGESLREIADEAFLIHVIFFGEQAKVVAQREKALEGGRARRRGGRWP